jgi:hypothetical protein
MNLTTEEIKYLSAFLQEEEDIDLEGPAHEQAAAHKIHPNILLSIIDAWAYEHHTVPRDLLRYLGPEDTPWPWPTKDDFKARRNEAKNLLLTKQTEP